MHCEQKYYYRGVFTEQKTEQKMFENVRTKIIIDYCHDTFYLKNTVTTFQNAVFNPRVHRGRFIRLLLFLPPPPAPFPSRHLSCPLIRPPATGPVPTLLADPPSRRAHSGYLNRRDLLTKSVRTDQDLTGHMQEAFRGSAAESGRPSSCKHWVRSCLTSIL